MTTRQEADKLTEGLAIQWIQCVLPNSLKVYFVTMSFLTEHFWKKWMLGNSALCFVPIPLHLIELATVPHSKTRAYLQYFNVLLNFLEWWRRAEVVFRLQYGMGSMLFTDKARCYIFP